MAELHCCLFRIIPKDLCDHAVWLDHGVARMQGEVNKVCSAYMEQMQR